MFEHFLDVHLWYKNLDVQELDLVQSIQLAK